MHTLGDMGDIFHPEENLWTKKINYTKEQVTFHLTKDMKNNRTQTSDTLSHTVHFAGWARSDNVDIVSHPDTWCSLVNSPHTGLMSCLQTSQVDNGIHRSPEQSETYLKKKGKQKKPQKVFQMNEDLWRADKDTSTKRLDLGLTMSLDRRSLTFFYATDRFPTRKFVFKTLRWFMLTLSQDWCLVGSDSFSK